MNPDLLVCELHEPDLLDTIRSAWDEFNKQCPEPKTPSFLDPCEFLVSRDWCGFGTEHDAALKTAAMRILSQPALCRLAAFYAWKVFDSPAQFCINHKDRWPKLNSTLGDQAGFFFLLIGLSLVPRLRRYHQMLGVPETVTRETSQQVRCFCDNFQRAKGGDIGIFTNQLNWLRNYVRGQLYFRIGRLEYWARGFDAQLTVFRHRQTGRVIALANDEACFNPEGLMDEPDKRAVGAPTWNPTLRLTEDAVVGFPISPRGSAEHREIRLPFAEWQLMLGPGDPVLDIHIPPGGDMGPDKCLDSLTRARDFFKTTFPHRAPVGFICRSWIFSPCLEHCLPPESNLVRFLKEMYLFPIASTDPNIWFVFFQDKFDPATAPRNTSLQRALLDYLVAGHTWRNGGMFFLADDLPAFGTQGYRANWPVL
ncbi:MAG: DUF5596 domain-containing protein [Verrucomicrobia bacterium]|nr:DUF5596 domain-containing protein [Verrucomicrobiota bacterium]MBU4291687.1 DUF5596 domain-containing protein [Verrucomicrobiota bacterium]MBU4430309.1 DUF5596 domain-containing protein [Verrucomicrobiota bacterium]MCG2680416.1 acyltransferase domain-containing protein [Kiritimatiellia bacterium]